MSNLKVMNPPFMSEWDYGKNDILPENVTTGSKKKVWWKCDLNHSWETSIEYRNRGFGNCKTCKSIITNTKLMSEWDYNKNTLSPEALTPGSGKRAWWKCHKNHSWTAAIKDRATNTNGCPICASQSVLQGYNDLLTTHPELEKQWAYDRNLIKVSEITAGSKKLVWWTDTCGHYWEMTPNHKTKLKNQTCKICSSIKILKPEWAAQWNYDKNIWTPEQVTINSEKKIHWISAECHHTWVQTPLSRNVNNSNCQVCNNKQVNKGKNDLLTTHPDLFKQWDFQKNSISLTEVTFGSQGKAWWLCSSGHSSYSKIADRVRGSGCPDCTYQISQAERDILEFLESFGVAVEMGDRSILDGRELDLYLPEYGVAVEYNGLYWHSERTGRDKSYHYDKWQDCKAKGIQLITVWEDDWVRDSGLIKRMLLRKIGLSDEFRVGARKCDVSFASNQDVESFLNLTHIQGSINGSYNVVLRHDGEIVAVGVFKKRGEDILELVRYSTSCIVPGGFTKILKFVDRSLVFDRVVTFSDNCISDGALYLNHGFVSDGEILPDYRYVVNNKREHKFGYRLKRFKNDSALIWKDGATEKELAELNKIFRIWDAGKVRYIRYTSNNDKGAVNE